MASFARHSATGTRCTMRAALGSTGHSVRVTSLAAQARALELRGTLCRSTHNTSFPSLSSPSQLTARCASAGASAPGQDQPELIDASSSVPATHLTHRFGSAGPGAGSGQDEIRARDAGRVSSLWKQPWSTALLIILAGALVGMALITLSQVTSDLKDGETALDASEPTSKADPSQRPAVDPEATPEARLLASMKARILNREPLAPVR